MPRLDESLDLNSDDLGERVLALLRFYGRGKRSAFVQQIARKSVSIGDHDESSFWNKWWQIYHRLCDFGLITQTGRAPDVSWQWMGDRILVLQGAEALFPTSSLRIESFAKLCSQHSFQEEVVYQLNLEAAGEFSIRYLVSHQVDSVLGTIRNENLAINTAMNDSIIGYLPSAQDVFGRTAKRTASLPEAGDMEQRGVSSSRWVEYRDTEIDSSCLLRKAREDRPGFRYWLIENPGNQIYEVPNSDWLPLLLWWVGRRQWPLAYEPTKRLLFVPKGLYFSSPVMIRHALILNSMRWPKTASATGESGFVFADFPISDVRHLARLYTPALKVNYVQ